MITTRFRLLCLSVVLFAFSASLLASPSVRIVRLSLAQGDVQIDRNAGDGWEQAITNMPVIGGARLYAAENSKAELELEDGSSVRLVGPAQIAMTELSMSPKGFPVNVIQVQSGEIYINARQHQGDDFRIIGPTGESFAITQPSRLRFTVDQQTASLALNAGEVAIQSDGPSSTLHAGQTYNYVLGQPESSVRQDTVRPESEDTWNQQRDSYNDQYASAGIPRPAPSAEGEAQNPNAPDQSTPADPNAEAADSSAPGAADLGYYGAYSDLPGYGVAWQPNDVGPDWDPFDNGAWSYYPGWGWTFVSGYDWGWAPFFFGDWCYVNGRGWWWRPNGGRGGPWHGPHHPGNPVWHPQPRYNNHPSVAWSAPHPPAHVTHGTVALAGSHLRVGPIGQTHASAESHGLGNATGSPGAGFKGPGATGVGRGVGTAGTNGSGTTAAGSGLRTTTPAGTHVPGASHGFVGNTTTRIGTTTITGQKGSYAVSGPGITHNGYEVHRPPSSLNSGPGPVSRTYTYNGATQGTTTQSTQGSTPPRGTLSGQTIPGETTTQPRSYAYQGSTAVPHTYTSPSAPIQHAPTSAPSVSSAPHVSSGGGYSGGGGGGAVSHSSGGFSGGGAGGGSHVGGGGHR